MSNPTLVSQVHWVHFGCNITLHLSEIIKKLLERKKGLQKEMRFKAVSTWLGSMPAVGDNHNYPLLCVSIVLAILNNLHQAMDHVPVVMFYPGRYGGQEVILFSSIKDDNYYKAFRLVG